MEAAAELFDLVSSPLPRPPGRTDLLQGIEQAEFAICTLTETLDEEVLSRARSLRMVANYAVGYNNIDLSVAQARGIIVTNTPDVLTETTADLTWALLLASARRVVEGDRLVRNGSWTGWEPTQLLGCDVHGETLGIIGMGRIGRAVARRGAGFGMKILHTAHSARAEATGTGNELGAGCSLATLLEEAKFVTLHVPLTSETHHLISTPEFRRMRRDAILINTSRGAVVNEAALAEALKQGLLAGAGLDVYEREPEIHPDLPKLSQVTLLPHLGSATLATRIQMGMVCIKNLEAVLHGRSAPNRVV
jgi:glyoxylate reductase